MSIVLEVGLLSGKTATVKTGLNEDVHTLMLRAQTALGVGKGVLVDAAGRFLVASQQIRDWGAER